MFNKWQSLRYPFFILVCAFDLLAIVKEDYEKKSVVLAFYQLLSSFSTARFDCCKWHPQANNVIGVIEKQISKFMIIEIVTDNTTFDPSSLQNPAYIVDIHKVSSL